ncbi:MAG TPA: cobalamin biosynthesis protein CobW [Alphaproteobacteria bacterium]|nr:cobalamin biosynthesis protein CobW [Alphaproteobacteria bacterium]
MTATAKIPATVITGFLGAGKTSLIRHLLENANGRRLALIINEFGDIGVDGEILKACGIEGCGEDDVIELANGCICCTVADDFLPTIEALLNRPEPPDHIVIETSGLALPKPLVTAFNWPEVRTRVTVDGVIAVVDGRAVADGLFASDPGAVQRQREADTALDHESPLEEVFEDQIQCADMIILNKSDLLDAASLEAARSGISEHMRPAVKIVPTRHGMVDAAVLLGLAAAAEDDLASRPSHHDGEDDHDHDDFESIVVELDTIDEPAELIERLKPVVDAHGVLRVKGFATVRDRDMRLVVQGVGDRIQHYYDRDWAEGETRATRLVLIGLMGLDRSAIEAALAK